MLKNLCFLSREAVIIKLLYFLYYNSISGIQSFFSVILSEYGLNDAEIGMTYAVMSLAAILSPFCVGYIADKTKKTKIVLMVCVTISILSHCAPVYLLKVNANATHHKTPTTLQKNNDALVQNISISRKILFSASENFNFDDTIIESKKETKTQEPIKLTSKLLLSILLIFPCAFFDQGSKVLLDSSTYKMIISMKKEGQNLEFGQQRIFASIGFALSSIITGVLSTYLKTQFLKSSVQVGLSGAIGIVLLSVLAFGFECKECENEVRVKKNLGRIFRNYYILLTIVSNIVFYFFLYMIKNFISLFILDLNGTKLYVGLYIMLHYMFEIASTALAERFSDLMGGNDRVIWWALLTCGINRTILSFATRPYEILVFACTNGVAFGIYTPSVYNTIASHADESAISVSLSMIAAGSKIGAILANLVGGYILSIYSYKVLIQTSAYGTFGWLVCFTIISYFLMRPNRSTYIPLNEEGFELINDESTELTNYATSDFSRAQIG